MSTLLQRIIIHCNKVDIDLLTNALYCHFTCYLSLRTQLYCIFYSYLVLFGYIISQYNILIWSPLLLTVPRPNGKHCVVRCISNVISHPPDRGTVITVTYDSITASGKLQGAQFLRERRDIGWDYVVQDNQITRKSR
jgi:hypothetical protein